jgi:hypothetical protein
MPIVSHWFLPHGDRLYTGTVSNFLFPHFFQLIGCLVPNQICHHLALTKHKHLPRTAIWARHPPDTGDITISIATSQEKVAAGVQERGHGEILTMFCASRSVCSSRYRVEYSLFLASAEKKVIMQTIAGIVTFQVIAAGWIGEDDMLQMMIKSILTYDRHKTLYDRTHSL